jgi:hypothetical protein
MNRKILFSIFVIIFCQCLVVGISFSATINSFTVSPSSISFPDQDPDLYTEVSSATTLSVNISIYSFSTGDTWNLDIYSSTDLTSGANSIPIGNGRWTVTGTGTPNPPSLYNRALSKGVYVRTADGNLRRYSTETLQLSFTFYLTNLWTYATGNYSSVITLRLMATGAATQTRTFTLNLTVSPRAKLGFGMLSLSFPDASPNTVPSIPANENPVSVTSSTRTGSSLTATLNCLAGGDLIAGTSSIPIGNMTWQSTGSGYVPGTMSKTAGQTTGSWTGPGQRTGTLSYFLSNSWSYTTGNYSTTITYTLTAP